MTKIFHLASEFNGTGVGAEFEMNELVKRYLRGKHKANAPYFERTLTQVKVVRALTGLPDAEVFYSDVSLQKAGSTQSDEGSYFQNVHASLDQQVEAFAAQSPSVVIVAGGLALTAFHRIVLPGLKAAKCAPDLIVGVRNPSNQGHHGNLDDWKQRYEEAADWYAGCLSGLTGMTARLVARSSKTEFRLCIERTPE